MAIAQMGHTTAEIHSNKSLAQRREALDGFKSGKYRVLVATDIAARGLDVKGVELVVNYDIPIAKRRLRAPHRAHRARRRRGSCDLIRHARRTPLDARYRALDKEADHGHRNPVRPSAGAAPIASDRSDEPRRDSRYGSQRSNSRGFGQRPYSGGARPSRGRPASRLRTLANGSQQLYTSLHGSHASALQSMDLNHTRRFGTHRDFFVRASFP